MSTAEIEDFCWFSISKTFEIKLLILVYIIYIKLIILFMKTQKYFDQQSVSNKSVNTHYFDKKIPKSQASKTFFAYEIFKNIILNKAS